MQYSFPTDKMFNNNPIPYQLDHDRYAFQRLPRKQRSKPIERCPASKLPGNITVR